MSETSVGTPGYWYENDERARGVKILEAMRLYRAAESAMRRRTRDAMHMGENDLLALRYVIRAAQQGRSVGPKDIAKYLGVASPSVTALLDRLEKGGNIRRVPSPFDRRGLLIEPTAHADDEVKKTLALMHERMISATEGITPAEAQAIVGFLERLREAVDTIDAESPEQTI